MPVALTTETPYVSSQPYSNKSKNVRFIANTNVDEVKKACPWAVITTPHTASSGEEGHMAFKTVAGFSEWMSQKKK